MFTQETTKKPYGYHVNCHLNQLYHKIFFEKKTLKRWAQKYTTFLPIQTSKKMLSLIFIHILVYN